MQDTILKNNVLNIMKNGVLETLENEINHNFG
jgi:hypothetical protein